jgi:hypothetical protein
MERHVATFGLACERSLSLFQVMIVIVSPRQIPLGNLLLGLCPTNRGGDVHLKILDLNPKHMILPVAENLFHPLSLPFLVRLCIVYNATKFVRVLGLEPPSTEPMGDCFVDSAFVSKVHSKISLGLLGFQKSLPVAECLKLVTARRKMDNAVKVRQISNATRVQQKPDWYLYLRHRHVLAV